MWRWVFKAFAERMKKLNEIDYPEIWEEFKEESYHGKK